MMTVRVLLFASLRRYLPEGTGSEAMPVELPDGSTVSDLIGRLGFPADYAGMVIADDRHMEPSSSLSDGQEVSIFPPLAGGTAAEPGRLASSGLMWEKGRQAPVAGRGRSGQSTIRSQTE